MKTALLPLAAATAHPEIPMLFALIFPLYWCFVMGLIARLGGWHALAKRYPVRMNPTGEPFRWASMGIGSGMFPTNYGGCLFIHVDDIGISISTLFPFRPFHPPLQIPWTAIADCREKRWWIFRSLRVHLNDPPTRLVFRGKLAETIRREWELRCPPTSDFAIRGHPLTSRGTVHFHQQA